MKKFRLNVVILFSIFLASAFVNSFAERKVDRWLHGWPCQGCKDTAEKEDRVFV